MLSFSLPSPYLFFLTVSQRACTCIYICVCVMGLLHNVLIGRHSMKRMKEPGRRTGEKRRRNTSNAEEKLKHCRNARRALKEQWLRRGSGVGGGGGIAVVVGCLKCCFTTTGTVGLLRTAQDVHLDFHTAPELSSCCCC